MRGTGSDVHISDCVGRRAQDQGTGGGRGRCGEGCCRCHRKGSSTACSAPHSPGAAATGPAPPGIQQPRLLCRDVLNGDEAAVGGRHLRVNHAARHMLLHVQLQGVFMWDFWTA